MALHLNLYHEVLKAKALKRRDPLKLSLYGLAAIAAGFAAYYCFELLKLHSLNEDLARAKSEFDKMAPLAKVAKTKEDGLAGKAKSSDFLLKRIEGRFYWAPILGEIMRVVPREVQITRLNADVNGDAFRRCAISLDGISAGADPRKVAEDLRTALAQEFTPKFKNVTSTFRTLEDGTELVMLDGRQVSTATFGIGVQLYFGDDKPAVPAGHSKKR